jgi:hypothetical protein
MVIEGWDLLNLRQQTLVDLLDVRAGKRTCLGRNEYRQETNKNKE